MSPPTLSLLSALTLVIAGCSDRTTNLVNTDGGGTEAIDANVTSPEACGDDTCACDNGQDDDDDGSSKGVFPARIVLPKCALTEHRAAVLVSFPKVALWHGKVAKF